ncbi:MAG: BON domain-containing protein [Granulosicoccus sp.]
MKISLKSVVASLIIAGAMTGPAFALVPTQSIQGAVQSAISGGGNINVTVKDGVATLFGHVDDAYSEQAAKQAALRFDNVDRIIDLVTTTN